jgi:hypothetical protein
MVLKMSLRSSGLCEAPNSTASREASSIWRKTTSALFILDYGAAQYFVPEIRTKFVRGSESDFPADKRGQFPLQSSHLQITDAPPPVKLHQDVDVAIFPEAIRQHRPKKR